MKFNTNISDYGETDLLTGNIEIGAYAFDSPSLLKATIIHEYYHSVYSRINTNGTWSWKPD